MMDKRLFNGKNQILVRALYVGQRLELRSFDHTYSLASAPLMVTAGESGCVVMLRYGVIVLFGLTSMEEANFMEDLRPYIIDPFDQIEFENIVLVEDRNRKECDIQANIALHAFDIPRLQLVGDILAKSVVLAHYERVIASSFDRIEPLASTLQSRGTTPQRSHILLKHIGEALSIEAKMVGRAEISEKPELLWEHPEHERTYQRLQDEYELQERHLALEHKLSLISRTAETLLDLLHHKRSLRVEWYIVILIVIEVVLTLHDKFF